MTDPAPTPRASRRRFWRAGVLLLGGACVVAAGAWRMPADPVEPLIVHDTGRLRPLEPSAHLRVATFNVHAGVGLDGVCDLGRTAKELANVDLVALQEIRNPMTGQSQAADLAERLNLGWLFVPAERRWWHNHYGTALLTGVPLEDCVRIPLPTSSRQRFRAALLGNLRLQGRDVHVLAAHIDIDSNDDTRDCQLRTICNLFLSLNEPAILLGDLNAGPTHPEIVRLLMTPRVQNALANVATSDPAHVPIDWILTKGFAVVRAEWRESGASDHPLGWAELKLDERPDPGQRTTATSWK